MVVGAHVAGNQQYPGVSSSVGTGTVTLENGQFQADGPTNLTFSNTFKVNNSAFGSAIDSNGTTLTISGNITDGSGGPGKLTIRDSFGGGAVVLTGTNTYTGGTTICSCGALQLGDPTHTGSIIGAVTNEGVFDIVNANTSSITSIANEGGLTQFFNSTTVGTATVTNEFGGETDLLNSSGAGSAQIINHGGVTTFGAVGGTDTSTAADATITNNNGGTIFAAMSNAGSANITNRNGGGTIFYDFASAANASITNNNNGFTSFGAAFGADSPTAGNAIITNNYGSGQTDFNAFSTAGNATITTNSGAATYFYDNSTGGNARLIANGTGIVDFSGTIGPNGDGQVSAGSIEGFGTFYIGVGNTLSVGSNNLSTAVSGLIADYNPCGCYKPGPGTLEKVGSGALTLSDANTYSGGTILSGGTLVIGNNSALGTGTLSMAAGTTLSFLSSGNFTVANAITISGDPIFTPPAGTAQTISGVISDGSSPGVVDMTGAGTLVLSRINTYSGGTMISAGILQVTNNNSVGTGTVTVDGGVFQSGAAGLVFANVFAINTTDGAIDTQANTLTLSGTIGNGNGTTGALTKIGTGTLILTGSSNYTGATNVNAGTLALSGSGSIASSSGVNVTSAAATFDISRCHESVRRSRPFRASPARLGRLSATTR